VARLTSRFAGAGRADPFVNTALRFFVRTEPMLGVGGGIILRGGSLMLDLGYRYKKILASDSLQSALSGGGPIEVSQARIGVGVRFWDRGKASASLLSRREPSIGRMLRSRGARWSLQDMRIPAMKHCARTSRRRGQVLGLVKSVT
jgi:hypothetical protein